MNVYEVNVKNLVTFLDMYKRSLDMHADTAKILVRHGIKPHRDGSPRHPAVIEHCTHKMASELADARDILRQIAHTNVNSAEMQETIQRLAQAFFDVHPDR